MTRPKRHIGLLILLAGSCLSAGCAEARVRAGGPATERAEAAPLSDFEGRFAYRGQPVDLVASGGRLYAVIDDSAYPLEAVGGDRFRNSAGHPVEFLRDRSGRVTAVREGQDSFEKLSADVPRVSRLLLTARVDGPYRYRQPEALADGLDVASLGSGAPGMELSSSVVDGVVNGRFANVHSILVHHRGRLILEEYFHGFDRDRPHQMRSLTKGLIALVAGAAVDRNIVYPGDAALVPLASNPAALSPLHRTVSLSQLLSMRSGLSCDDENDDAAVNNDNLYGRSDWVEAFVTAPARDGAAPEAAYCSAGMLAAGRFLEVRTGSPISDFAREVLFRPMGITDDDWAWPFVLGSAGSNEFGQIRLRPRDMLKLGVMVLQQGRFNGQQILSQSWLTAMTTRHATIDGQGYGYGVWFRDYAVDAGGRSVTVSTIMFSGNGGQKIYVVPSLELVVVATGGSYNQGNAPINAMMVDVILPAMLGERRDGE